MSTQKKQPSLAELESGEFLPDLNLVDTGALDATDLERLAQLKLSEEVDYTEEDRSFLTGLKVKTEDQLAEDAKAAEKLRLELEDSKGTVEVVADPDEDPVDDEPAVNFWEEVAKETGVDIEGDFDDTVNGASKYVAKALEVGAQQFEEELKKKDPRGYSYLLHRSNGGSDVEFFKTYGEDLPEVTALIADENAMKIFYEEHLLSLGNSPKHAKAIVQMAADDETLEDEVKAAYDKRRVELDSAQEALDKITTENNKKAQTAQSEMTVAIDAIIKSGEIGGFTIPPKDQKEFSEVFKGQVRYSDGKFFLVSELSKEGLDKEMQKEFLKYRKGDLKDLVESEVKKSNAKRLRLVAGQSAGSDAGVKKSHSKKPSLGEL